MDKATKAHKTRHEDIAQKSKREYIQYMNMKQLKHMQADMHEQRSTNV